MTTARFMTIEAIVLGLMGVVLLFAPELVASGLGGQPTEFWSQIAAAGTLAFAAQNWFGRSAIYGAIYGKPIVYANMVFGLITTLALLRLVMDGSASWIFLALYGQYGAGYAYLMFNSPSTSGSSET